MKVKCITSHIHPVFIVGEIYETDGRYINGNEIEDEESWVIDENLEIQSCPHALASFERVDS